MSEFNRLKNILYIWSLSAGFPDLARLLNGEQDVIKFIEKQITADKEMIAERDNQIRIQNERLGHDETKEALEARKEKITIIETQRTEFNNRLKFYQDVLKELQA